MAKVNLITQSEYAKQRGVSEAAVSKAVSGGRISLIDGKIDPVVADMQWKANSRARASSQQPCQLPLDEAGPSTRVPSEADGYTVSRNRREAAEASLAEMKEAEMRGKLVDKAEVDAAIFEIARAMRDGLTNCAKRIAAEVLGLASADACEAVIEREHRALLQNMTHQIVARLGAPTEAAAG